MQKVKNAPKLTKRDWCEFIVISMAIIIVAVWTAISALPQFPTAKSKESCISEMERYLQEPLEKVSEGFEITNVSDTIRVKDVRTEVEYICTTLENGERVYSLDIPSVVIYVLTIMIFTLLFTFMYTLVGVLIYAFGSTIKEYHEENK